MRQTSRIALEMTVEKRSAICLPHLHIQRVMSAKQFSAGSEGRVPLVQ